MRTKPRRASTNESGPHWTFRSELGRAGHQGGGGGGGDHHGAGVGGADPVLQVEAAGHPVVIGEALSGELSPEVEESPAGVLGEI